MASTPGHDDLRTSRQLLVVVRLLLDVDWQLQHGELVDVDETSRGRFAGWEDLTPAIRRVVAEERETHAARAAN